MPQDVIRLGPTRPAGFWIRAVALVIDLLVIVLVRASYGYFARRLLGSPDLGWRVLPTVWLFTLLFTVAYTSVLHAALGQTIGKSVLRIQVIGIDGRRVTLGAALLRWLAYWLSALPFGLGYLMAGLRRDKRALHDLIAGTRVEHVPAEA